MTSRPLQATKKLMTRVQLAIIGRQTGYRHIASRPDVPSLYQVTTGTNQMITDVNDSQISASRPAFFSDDRPLMENDDVWRDRIWKRGQKRWQRWLKKIMALIAFSKRLQDPSLSLAEKISMLRLGRELTALEISQVKENVERRRLEAFHKERAARGAKMLIQALTNIGIARIRSKDGNSKVIKMVRFDRISFSPLQYKYHVDALRSPVNISEINKPEVMTHLSAAVAHPVRGDIQQDGSYVTGLNLTIEIAATLGIPNRCSFADLLPLVPESAPPLAFLVGYGENKRPEWRSLEDMPHLLGGGQTNGGKSNMMHVMLCTMIARNAPTDVKFLMVDLKFGGIELGRYEGIPHLIHKRDEKSKATEYVEAVPTGIAENSNEGLEILKFLAHECDRRGRLFKEQKIQNLKIWNRKHKNNRLAEIVVAIDELALLLDDPETRKETFAMIRSLASTARAAGGHLIAFTQSANRNIINETVKVNFPGRICFSTPDASSSILFVGDGSAINLMPAGRAYFKYGTNNFMVQTPLIEPHNIAEIIERAKGGETTHVLKKHSLTPEEIIDWSIEDNASSLATRDLFNKFGQSRGLTQAEIGKILIDMEKATNNGEIFTVGDRYYQVLPGAGSRPRIVARIETNAGTFIDQNILHSSKSQIADDKFTCPHCTALRSEYPCEYCGGE